MKQPKEEFGPQCYKHGCNRALVHKAECFFYIRHIRFKKPATFGYRTDISFSEHLLLRLCYYRSMHYLPRSVYSEYVLTFDTAEE